MRLVAFDMGKRNFAFSEMAILDNKDTSSVIFFDVHDFGNVPPSVIFKSKLIPYLDQFSYIWERIDVVLIEQQLSGLNIQAARLACHVSAYFFHRFPRLEVHDYPASYKTKLLGEKKTKNHRERKQFAIQKVQELFLEKDPVLSDWFSTLKKKDDVADCILMCFTFKLSPLYQKKLLQDE